MSTRSKPNSPIRETDEGACAVAQQIMNDARTAALGVIAPDSGWPQVTRIATVFVSGTGLCTLISDLSTHAAALRANPKCSLLIGDLPERGDPLNHPRLTLQATAQGVDKGALRARWLSARPKTKLYFDFADFRILRFDIISGFLNGGFGKAFDLTPKDLLHPPE